MLAAMLLVASCSSGSGRQDVDAGAPRSTRAPISAEEVSVRSRFAAALTTDGTDLMVVDGADATGRASAFVVRPDGTVAEHALADVALAEPIAWWDGTQYVVAGLPCPGWQGQLPPDDGFFSEFCHTTAFQVYGLDPATGKVRALGEVDGSEHGFLNLGPVNGSVALLSRPPGYSPVRVDTAGQEALTATEVDLVAPGGIGVCALGDGFVVIDTSSLSTDSLTTYQLGSRSTTWDKEQVPINGVDAPEGLYFGGCQGGNAIVQIRKSPRDIGYLSLSLTDPKAPVRQFDLPGLTPLASLGTISDTPVAMTSFASPVHFRVDRIIEDRVEPLVDLPGVLETPMMIALTKTSFAYFPPSEDRVRLQIVIL